MKKELEYFAIEGAFGGNQDWFSNVVMNMGGCAAATACDSCIYFAKYMGMRALYPYDINNLTKEDYKRFSQVMKPYIRPRVGGVRKLSWYVDGFSKYIAAVQAKLDIEEAGFLNIRMQEISGNASRTCRKPWTTRKPKLSFAVAADTVLCIWWGSSTSPGFASIPNGLSASATSPPCTTCFSKTASLRCTLPWHGISPWSRKMIFAVRH